MIEGLQAHRTKQSTMIAKLKEEIDHLQHDILERDSRLKYLEDELKVERRDCGIAYEHAQGARREVENLQAQLKEEVDAHEKLKKVVARMTKEAEEQRAEMQMLQGRLSHLESEAYRVEIVDKYCDSPLGKVEVALACKVGFECLLKQLPRESRPKPDRLHYPSRFATCLDILKEIEAKGGTLMLEVDDGDEGGEKSGESFAGESWADDEDEEVAPASSQPTPTLEPSAALHSPTPDPSRVP